MKARQRPAKNSSGRPGVRAAFLSNIRSFELFPAKWLGVVLPTSGQCKP